MRVIIMDHSNEGYAYLIKLHTNELINEIKSLVSKSLNEKAMESAITNGRFEGVFYPEAMGHITADMILSRTGVSWDLMN